MENQWSWAPPQNSVRPSTGDPDSSQHRHLITAPVLRDLYDLPISTLRRSPEVTAFPFYGVPIPTPLAGLPSHLSSTAALLPSAPARPGRLKNSATPPAPMTPRPCSLLHRLAGLVRVQSKRHVGSRRVALSLKSRTAKGPTDCLNSDTPHHAMIVQAVSDPLRQIGARRTNLKARGRLTAVYSRNADWRTTWISYS